MTPLTLHNTNTGAKDYATVGYNLLMALILSNATAIFPISVIWFFSKPILIFFGQDVTVAARGAPYLQILIPSIFMFAIRQCIQTWLQVQGIVKPFTVNAAITAILSVPLSWLLIVKMGYLGGALAVTIVSVINFFLDMGFVYFSGASY